MSMFRAQLLLEEQRRLFDVWNSAAGCSAMPTRESFQPRAFGPLLPFISLIETKALEGSRVRVAGSALRDVFGDEFVEMRKWPIIDNDVSYLYL